MTMREGLLALALLLVPAGAMAQQKTATLPHTGPIERLLQHRADLALTGDQVQKLEGIRQQSVAREQELVAGITAARGAPPGTPLRTQLATPAERQAAYQKMQAVRPQMDELRQLHQRQIQEARVVLTAGQNAKAGAFIGGYAHGGMGPGRMRHGGRGGMGPRGMGQGGR